LFDYEGRTYYAPFAAGLLKATAPVDPDQVAAEAGRGHERSHPLRPKRYTSTVNRDRPFLSRAEVTVGRVRKRPAAAGSRPDPDRADDSPDFQRHASADDLELYALKRLAEPDLGRVERHLLVCEGCRRQLTETDATVSLIRAACRDYEGSGKG
jgi:hypothetical protein